MLGKSALNDYPTIYIYCTEVRLSFSKDMSEKFERAGERTFI